MSYEIGVVVINEYLTTKIISLIKHMVINILLSMKYSGEHKMYRVCYTYIYILKINFSNIPIPII